MENEKEIIKALSDVANIHGLDTEANMPDFVVGEYLMDSFKALARADRKASEWIVKLPEDLNDKSD